MSPTSEVDKPSFHTTYLLVAKIHDIVINLKRLLWWASNKIMVKYNRTILI